MEEREGRREREREKGTRRRGGKGWRMGETELHVGASRSATVRRRKERAKESWEGSVEDQHCCTVPFCSDFLPIPKGTSAWFHKFFLSIG